MTQGRVNSFVFIRSYKFNLCAKLEYRIKHLPIEPHFHPERRRGDVAQSCEIKCMPTFHFYKNGKKLDDFSGSNQAKLEEMVNQYKN